MPWRWPTCCAARLEPCSSASRSLTSIRGPGSRPGTGVWRGTARSAIPLARCGNRKWNRRSSGRCGRWRTSLGYDGERADTPVVDQLEAILRGVAEELAGWRARALKAETDLKELRGGAGGGPTRLEPEGRNRRAGDGA